MLIHMENAMKAHQHISYTKRSFKKNNFNTKSEHSPRRIAQIAHF